MDGEQVKAAGPRRLTTDDGRVLHGCDDMSIEASDEIMWIALCISSAWIYAPFTPDEARQVAAKLCEFASEIEAAN